METIQASEESPYKTELHELLRRHAAQKVELASQGLFDTHGREMNQRHLQEKAELLLKYPQEAAALMALGRLAITDEGVQAIIQARQTAAESDTQDT